MSEKGRYDGVLQMFCDDAREPDLTALRFLRWLAERGKLEHSIAGPPSGPVATMVRLDEARRHEPELVDAA